jgi:hypothetical protein
VELIERKPFYEKNYEKACPALDNKGQAFFSLWIQSLKLNQKKKTATKICLTQATGVRGEE